MGRSCLTLNEVTRMFLHVSRGMLISKDLLTRADQVIGDGDHGVGMARGFGAVQLLLESHLYTTVGELLRGIGTSLITSVGGASGAVFGTLFTGGAKQLEGVDTFDSKALALLLLDGLRAVRDRGKARVGDKTMVDALEPAALIAQGMTGLPLGDSIIAAVEAAKQGMERTREMVARVGKAKTLGDRSLGHPDPGAVSMYLVLKFMMEYVTGTSDVESPA